MRPNLLTELLKHNPNPAVYKTIELVTCQWVDPKEHNLDSRLCLDLIEIEKITTDDLFEMFETGHSIRELINFTISAFHRGIIAEGITAESLVDAEIWGGLTFSDIGDVLKLFKFASLEDLVETLFTHMNLLSFIESEVELTSVDSDLARLTTSLVYREYAEPGHKVSSSPRLFYFVKSLLNETDYELEVDNAEHLMVGFSLAIFKPIETPINWVNLAMNRGILVSGLLE